MKESETGYYPALADLLTVVRRLMFKHDLRVYELYELLKDCKDFIKFDKKTNKRLLGCERLMIK